MNDLINKVLLDRKVIRDYLKGNRSLREVAKKFNTNHHTVKRILKKNNIEYKPKQHPPKKPRSYYYKPARFDTKEGLGRWNMVTHLSVPGIELIDIEKYDNFEKLKFLNKVGLSRKDRYGNKNKEEYILYLDKFYFDIYFNHIYDLWVKNDRNKWYRPTLDHIIPKSRGGSNDLNNLQFLTWFENRAKAEMNQDEWDNFKFKTNTKSDLFRS